MSVIVRLKNLPWSASSKDIRRFFDDLDIPDGGVHIIGGDEGDAFIAFRGKEDAYKALLRDGERINGKCVRLYSSSRAELEHMVDQVRESIEEEEEEKESFSRKDSERFSLGDKKGSDSGMISRYRSPDRSYRHSDKSRQSPQRRFDRSRSPPMFRDEDYDQDKPSDYEMNDRRRRTSPFRERESDRFQSIRSESWFDQISNDEKIPTKDYDAPYRNKFEQREVKFVDSEKSYERYKRDFMSPDSYRRRSPSQSDEDRKSASLDFMKLDVHASGKFREKRHDSPPVRNEDFLRSNKDELFSGAHEQLDQKSIQLKKTVSNKPETEISYRNSPSVSSSELVQFDRTRPPPSNNTTIPLFSDSQSLPFRNVQPPPLFNVQPPPFPNYPPPPPFTGWNQLPPPPNFQPPPSIPNFQPPPPASVTQPLFPTQYPAYSENPPQGAPFPNREFTVSQKSLVSPQRSTLSENQADKEQNKWESSNQNSKQEQTQSHCIQIKGVPEGKIFIDIQNMLKDVYIPMYNIKWDKDEKGQNTGTVYVRLNNEDDFKKVMKRTTYTMDTAKVTITKAPEMACIKFFGSYEFSRPPLRSNLKDGNPNLCYRLKGLPYETTEDHIIAFFSGLRIKDVLVLYDKNGLANGSGFVQFKTVDEYRKAFDKSGCRIGRRYIRMYEEKYSEMEEARSNAEHKSKPMGDMLKQGPITTSIMGIDTFDRCPMKRSLCALLTGLPTNVFSASIYEFFLKAGARPHAVHIILGEKMRPIGKAYAEFQDLFDFDNALKQNQQIMNGQHVGVKQVLFEEMVKVLDSQKAHHISGIHKTETKVIEIDESEKVPYLWDPPEEPEEPASSHHDNQPSVWMNSLNTCERPLQGYSNPALSSSNWMENAINVLNDSRNPFISQSYRNSPTMFGNNIPGLDLIEGYDRRTELEIARNPSCVQQQLSTFQGFDSWPARESSVNVDPWINKQPFHNYDHKHEEIPFGHSFNNSIHEGRFPHSTDLEERAFRQTSDFDRDSFSNRNSSPKRMKGSWLNEKQTFNENDSNHNRRPNRFRKKKSASQGKNRVLVKFEMKGKQPISSGGNLNDAFDEKEEKLTLRKLTPDKDNNNVSKEIEKKSEEKSSVEKASKISVHQNQCKVSSVSEKSAKPLPDKSLPKDKPSNIESGIQDSKKELVRQKMQSPKPEPVRDISSKQDSGQGKAPKQDSIRGNVPKQDLRQGNVPKQDSSHGNAPKQDSSQGNASKQDSNQGNAPKQDSIGGNTPKQDSIRRNTPKQDSIGGNTPKQDSFRRNTPKQDLRQGNAPKQDSSQGNAPRQDSGQENAPKQNSGQENAPKQNSGQENAPKQNSGQEKAPKGNNSARDRSLKRNNSARDKSPKRNNSARDKSPKRDPVRDRSPRRDPVRDNRPPRRDAIRNRSPRRDPVRDRLPRYDPARDRSPRREPFRNRSLIRELARSRSPRRDLPYYSPAISLERDSFRKYPNHRSPLRRNEIAPDLYVYPHPGDSLPLQAPNVIDPCSGQFSNKGCTIQADNVPPHVGLGDLLSFFRGYRLSSKDIIRRFSDSGEPTGDVRIAFRSSQEATTAMMKLNGVPLCGVPINMFFA